MKIRRIQSSVSTNNQGELARFYEQLLHADRHKETDVDTGEQDGHQWVEVTTDEGMFRINFEFDRAWQAPVWPSELGQNNMTQHLCIFVDNLDEAVTHALNVGATMESPQFEEGLRVLRDPQGHPFCLIRAAES